MTPLLHSIRVALPLESTFVTVPVAEPEPLPSHFTETLFPLILPSPFWDTFSTNQVKVEPFWDMLYTQLL